MDEVIIPAGTILYRAAKELLSYDCENIVESRRKCSDTGKTGVYFGNYLLISMAIATEYKSDQMLGVFITTKDIKLTHGKYSYREVHPERFEGFLEGTAPHPGELLPDENIGHFDDNVGAILNDNLMPTIENEGEVFIASKSDLANIKLIAKYMIHVDYLIASVDKMELADVPRYDINFYIRAGALTLLQ